MFLKKYLFIIVFFLFLSSHFSAEAKGVDVLQLKISPPQKMGSVFEGSSQSLNAVLDDLAQDSSMLDSIYLFAAANTALSLNRIKDAAFFLYAAKMRLSFDEKRYNVVATKEIDPKTELGSLYITLAVQINPLILRRPQDFKAVIERLEQWPIIPSESELYHQPVYGRLKLVKSQWIAEAKMIKQASLKELLTLQSLINNPEYYQALIFVQDYIDQKIENTPANNDQYLLYVEQLERFNKNAHF